MRPAPHDIAKVDLLRELGYGGDTSLYAGALEAAGLSNPRKDRIALDKRDRVAGALRAAFVRVCSRGDCSSMAAGIGGGRAPAPAATQADCEVCGGSRNRSAVDEMVRAFDAAGWKRLVVVGGSAATREDLLRQIADRLEVRLVDGTIARRRVQAEADLVWADRVVIWASTELNHKVSELYRGPKVITARSRGVAELAQAATTSAIRTNSAPSHR
ncbi:MAG: hypothetical protein KF699_01340 [Phycisphaeraceae bacterium]|nr:hypothetical protein [Phycisphaeraceae bacterium]